MEEFRIAILLERSPVTANRPVKSYDRLEYAAVVMRPVTVLRLQYDITAFIADEIFIIWRNEQVSSPAESPRPAIIRKIKFTTGHLHLMDRTSHEIDSLAAVADIKPGPPDKVLESSWLAALEILSCERK